MCRGRCRCGLQVFGSVPRRDADVHQVLSSDGRGCPLRQRPALLHQDLQQVTHIQGLGGRVHSGRCLCPALLRMLTVSATPLCGRSVLPPKMPFLRCVCRFQTSFCAHHSGTGSRLDSTPVLDGAVRPMLTQIVMRSESKLILSLLYKTRKCPPATLCM